MKVKCIRSPDCNKCAEIPLGFKHFKVHEQYDACKTLLCNGHEVKCMPVLQEMTITEDGNFTIKEEL